jgi:hypothetical protein
MKILAALSERNSRMMVMMARPPNQPMVLTARSASHCPPQHTGQPLGSGFLAGDGWGRQRPSD